MQALDNEEALKSANSHHQYLTESASPAMRMVERMIANVATTDFPVLLMGESGVGKEAVALHIHRSSPRSPQLFTRVMCGTLTPESLETLRNDCDQDDGRRSIGTLFLDEISELTTACQFGLLQAMRDGERVLADRPFRARIISATSLTPEELEQALDHGALRKDLFFRLNGVCLRLPPLRERKEDIPALVEFFLQKNSSLLGRPKPSLSPRTLQILQEYSWPGNIRELENTIRRVVALGGDSAELDLGPLVTAKNSASEHEKLSLKQTARMASRQAEKELILKVLGKTHWNRKRAAQQLQISYKALLYKLRQMGLDESEVS
jgi:DNA-binding NtrC family response regulator